MILFGGGVCASQIVLAFSICARDSVEKQFISEQHFCSSSSFGLSTVDLRFPVEIMIEKLTYKFNGYYFLTSVNEC